jgi:plastocyanin
MQGFRSRKIIALTFAATAVACGGSGGEGNHVTEPNPSVLTTVQVTPNVATIFTVAPGNSLGLTVIGKDQYGVTMNNVGAASFSSGDPSVATVSSDGVITAVGVGSVQILASLTAGGVTKSASTNIVVQAATGNAAVSAPVLDFLPDVVDVSAGGVVTWTVGDIHHTVHFNTAGAPDNIPEMLNQSVSRVFPTAGSYDYQCEIHPSMRGTVRVH